MRSCDQHPPLPVPRPRRPPEFDADYNPAIHKLVFDARGSLAGYIPRVQSIAPSTEIQKESK